MYKGFWQTLQPPIIGLSPMDGVTDQPYRFIQKKYGSPDVIYTEFTSVEGVCHGATRLLTDFLYDETQRPIIAQVYGTTPQYFRETATLLCELGFDGVDINMGCPAKNVAHSGAGAALILTPKLAQEIVYATKAGIHDWMNGKTSKDCEHITAAIADEVAKKHLLLPEVYREKRAIPVSIKTRAGYDKPVVGEWIPTLLETEPAAIALHGRTLKQHYTGLASWEEIGKAAAITKQTETLILGNGDIESRADALQRVTQYGTDGALLGRTTFGNPFVFLDSPTAAPKTLFEIAIEHAYLYEDTYKDDERYHFMPMRKHLGWYVRSIPNASQIRIEVFRSESAAQVEETFKQFQLL